MPQYKMGITKNNEIEKEKKTWGHKSWPCGFDAVAIRIRSEGKRRNRDMGFDAGNR